MAAAVADWRPDIAANSKIKKDADRVVPLIKLVENPDILATLAQRAKRPRLVIGFAAETDDVVANAMAKRARKGADWIVANDVSGDVMGGDRNRVHLITAQRRRRLAGHDQGRSGRAAGRRIAEQLKGRGMKVGIKRLPHARDLPLPHYATAGSAGLDLLAAVDDEIELLPGQRMAVPCGIAIELPHGLRGAGAAALGPGAQPRHHRAQRARHHRQRLSRRRSRRS